MLFLRKNIKYYGYLLSFEVLFREVNSLNLLSFNKQCVTRRLQDSVYSSLQQVSKIFEKNLPDEEIKALKNLTENKDLVIQIADKGNSILILNKNDYILRLTRILDTISKFKDSSSWGRQSPKSYNSYKAGYYWFTLEFKKSKRTFRKILLLVYIHQIQNQGYLRDLVKFTRLRRKKFSSHFLCNIHAHLQTSKVLS